MKKKPFFYFNSFDRGYFTAIALMSLWMDFRGQEVMAESIANNWTPWYITVPLAFVLIGLALRSKFIDYEQEADNTKAPTQPSQPNP